MKTTSIMLLAIALASCTTQKVVREVTHEVERDTVTKIEIREKIITLQPPAIKDTMKPQVKTDSVISGTKNTKAGKVNLKYFPLLGETGTFEYYVEPPPVTGKSSDTSKSEKIREKDNTKETVTKTVTESYPWTSKLWFVIFGVALREGINLLLKYLKFYAPKS